jgi:hypothetical protein
MTMRNRVSYYAHRSHDHESATLIIRALNHTAGITLWRRGAISLLWNGGVPLQLVCGDWWQAHPEAKR